MAERELQIKSDLSTISIQFYNSKTDKSIEKHEGFDDNVHKYRVYIILFYNRYTGLRII